jgi:hypothetical protein
MRGQDVDGHLDGAVVAGPRGVEDREDVLLVGEAEEVGFLGRGRA